jgi:hypothetical protein
VLRQPTLTAFCNEFCYCLSHCLRPLTPPAVSRCLRHYQDDPVRGLGAIHIYFSRALSLQTNLRCPHASVASQNHLQNHKLLDLTTSMALAALPPQVATSEVSSPRIPKVLQTHGTGNADPLISAKAKHHIPPTLSLFAGGVAGGVEAAATVSNKCSISQHRG